MKNFKLNITIVLLFVSTVSFSQIDAYNFYSFRLNNMFNANAAYTGKGDGIKVMLNAQSQNKGVSYANKNFMGGIHSKVRDNQALGLRLISDTRGAFQVFKSDITYAYLVKLNDRHKLNFGLNAGILNTNLSTQRIDNFDIIDQSDELLYNTKFNTLQFTAGVGLLYNFDRLEVSLSVPSLISTNENIYAYMNASVFYTFEINEKINVTPWLNYQNIPITSGIGGLFVKGEYMGKFWLQTGVQTNKSFAMMVGVNVGQFAMGYGYNFSNNIFGEISSGVNEVNLSYRILKSNGSGKSQSSQSLGKILNELNSLIDKEVTEENRASLLEQLQELKKELLEVEIDNENPRQAKKVAKQLDEINEKLKILTEKLINK